MPKNKRKKAGVKLNRNFFRKTITNARTGKPVTQAEVAKRFEHPFQLAGPLTDSEAATILAALRVFQSIMRVVNGSVEYTAADLRSMEHFEDGVAPLTSEQIDTLAERINFEPAATAPVPHAPVARVAIFLEGGLVQDVVSDVPLKVLKIDYDVEGADEEELSTVPEMDGKDEQAFVSTFDADVMPDRVEQLFQSQTA